MIAEHLTSLPSEAVFTPIPGDLAARFCRSDLLPLDMRPITSLTHFAPASPQPSLNLYRGEDKIRARRTRCGRESAHNLFVQQNSHEQARLLKMLISNRTFDRGSLSVAYRKPFDMLVEGNESGNWLGVRDDFRHWLRLGLEARERE